MILSWIYNIFGKSVVELGNEFLYSAVLGNGSLAGREGFLAAILMVNQSRKQVTF